MYFKVERTSAFRPVVFVRARTRFQRINEASAGGEA